MSEIEITVLARLSFPLVESDQARVCVGREGVSFPNGQGVTAGEFIYEDQISVEGERSVEGRLSLSGFRLCLDGIVLKSYKRTKANGEIVKVAIE